MCERKKLCAFFLYDIEKEHLIRRIWGFLKRVCHVYGCFDVIVPLPNSHEITLELFAGDAARRLVLLPGFEIPNTCDFVPATPPHGEHEKKQQQDRDSSASSFRLGHFYLTKRTKKNKQTVCTCGKNERRCVFERTKKKTEEEEDELVNPSTRSVPRPSNCS